MDNKSLTIRASVFRLCLLGLILCGATLAQCQHATFTEVSDQKNLLQDTSNKKLLFFHFKGCAPCKRMITEVFIDSAYVDKLAETYDLYSIKGFDTVQMFYRTHFGVRTNPAFLFLDDQNVIKHKVVGFFEKDDFMSESAIAYSDDNLFSFDEEYTASPDMDLATLRKYVVLKENANELDTAIINAYFEKIPDNQLQAEAVIKDLMHYGYIKMNTLKHGTRYYNALVDAYHSDKYQDFDEYLRSRIIFSLNDALYGLIHSDDNKHFNSLVRELEQYENGKPTFLTNINTQDNYAMLPFGNPSFYCAYERAKVKDDKVAASNIFKKQFERLSSAEDYKTLNSLAWGIYEGAFNEDKQMGLMVIRRSLEIKPDYYNALDTHAALLFANGQHEAAMVAAQDAIDTAKKQDLDYSSTEELIQKYAQDKE